MSLIKDLNNLIESRYPLPVYYNEIIQKVQEWGYKVDNASRRLRPSDMPNIERLDKHGVPIPPNNTHIPIVAYKWKPTGEKENKDWWNESQYQRKLETKQLSLI